MAKPKPPHPTHIPKELVNSYLKTAYWVYTAPPFCIKLQEENDSLFDFMQNNNYRSWAFITAWNPYSQEKSLEENRRQNQLLEKEIIKESYPYYPAEGKLGDWKEESFFVLDVSKEKAVLLAREFCQNAILFGNWNGVELVFCT